ncbi:ATP synthase subunit d, mitochondrial-like [Babylonia areolata]|uniref:ATP synthase subunit d, mitochondrial-like n=1 Tax=Babylonia areolata TaxID=304850 RepID=UPI003FD001FE
MAARRIARSAVDWAAFKERVPPKQQEFYRAFKAKNDTFVNKVHQYPENLPKIDFAFYKARLPNPALADQFQTAYEGISVPYPADKSNMLNDIKADQKAAGDLSKAYIAERQEEINDANLLLSKIDKLPKPNEMTMEMYAYYFPNLAMDPVNRPSFWPHTPNMQPGNKDNHNI